MPSVVLIETASIVGWWTTYTASVSLAQRKSPETVAFSGALAGTLLGTVSLLARVPSFPETWADHAQATSTAPKPQRDATQTTIRKATPSTLAALSSTSGPLLTLAKPAAGHAAFFCIYEGLRASGHRRIRQDPRDDVPLVVMRAAVDAVAGGLAGMAYRATAIPFYMSGSVPSPLLRPGGPMVLATTFAVTATCTGVLQTLTDLVLGQQ
ncbi:hypothetical protein BC831DRAFT_453326 [Entophlyctis helioformis]|nr:hypothetical protein BC831DRAFT_453326 [Entophlyctis helioformis]